MLQRTVHPIGLKKELLSDCLMTLIRLRETPLITCDEARHSPSHLPFSVTAQTIGPPETN